jgi:cobalt-zinc-cadmium efflux system outer membrane protein
MRSGIVAVALGSSLLSAGLGRAQPPPTPTDLTLDALVARAVAHNPSLRAARAEVEAARGRLGQAGLRPNPMLDLAGQKALGPDNTLSVGLTVPLDLNGRKEGRVDVAEGELALRRLQLADRERRLRAEVRMKAGELLAAGRTRQIAEDVITISRRALDVVGARVRQGASPALDESLMLVEVSRLEAGLPILASRVEVLTLQLMALAGLTPDAPLSLRGDLGAPPSAPERGEALSRALSGRPDLAAARAEVAAAGARIRKEEADGRWDASVSLGYQRQDMGFDLNGLTDSGATRPIRDVFHFFGGGLTITLPVRNRNQGNIAAARAEADAATSRVEFAELAVRQEVDAALRQQEAAQKARDLYGERVRAAASRNLDVVRQAWELGRGTMLDVIAEQRRYLEIENGYTDLLRQVWDAAVEVRRAVDGER